MDILISMQPQVTYWLIMPGQALRRLSLTIGEPCTLSSGTLKGKMSFFPRQKKCLEPAASTPA